MRIEKFNIPEGWEHKKLGDICLPKEGLRRGPFGSAIKKEFFVPVGYKVYEQSNAIYDDVSTGRYFIDENKFLELKNFEVLPGDFIVSCSGTLGRIAQVPPHASPGVINQALLRIRLLPNVVDTKYFLYYFRSAKFQRMIFDQSQGTAMSNLIGIKDFKEVTIPTPPIETQSEIVLKIEELFSELDKSLELLKIVQEQEKVFRQSVLNYAFEGRLTNKGIKKGVLPKDWNFVKLRDVVSILGDGLHGTPKYTENGDYYFINGNNLSSGNIVFKSSTKRVSKEEYEKHKKNLTDRTILVSINGTLGNVAFYNNEKVILGKSACYFNLLDNVDKHYMKLILNGKTFLNYAHNTATGSTIPNVSLKAMREFEFPLPPIKEQQQIVKEVESRLTVADKIIEDVGKSILQIETLKQSVLKKAFEGKLV